MNSKDTEWKILKIIKSNILFSKKGNFTFLRCRKQ